MNFEFIPYTNFSLISSTTVPTILVYDKKPQDQTLPFECLGMSTFKFLTWKNTFSPKIEKRVIFLLQKIPEEFIYSILRNTYSRAIICTDDWETIERVFKRKVNTKILFCGPPKSIPQGPNLTEIELLCNHFVCFDGYNLKFEETYRSLRKDPQKNVVVLFPDGLVEKDDAMANSTDKIEWVPAKECKDREFSTCLVYIFDEKFSYFEFQEAVFLAPHRLTNGSIPSSSIRNLLTPGFFQTLEKTSQFSNLQNFQFYLQSLENDIFTKIITKTSLKIGHFPSLKVQEVSLGNVTFPLCSSRHFFDHIINCLRTVFEERSLFIKTLLPTVEYSMGGFYKKEFSATVSFPVLFDFQATSGFFISKKEAVNEASFKFLEILLSRGILDENMCVNSTVLSNCSGIQNLLIHAFSTCDPEEIEEIKINFLRSNSFKIVENEKLVEKNGEISLCRENPKNSASDLFKRKFMIDLSSITLDRHRLKDNINRQCYPAGFLNKKSDSETKDISNLADSSKHSNKSLNDLHNNNIGNLTDGASNNLNNNDHSLLVGDKDLHANLNHNNSSDDSNFNTNYDLNHNTNLDNASLSNNNLDGNNLSDSGLNNTGLLISYKGLNNYNLENISDKSLNNNSLLVNGNKEPINCHEASFFDEKSPTSKLEKMYRKIPSCLIKPTDSLALYTFSNSSTGIMCSDCAFDKCMLINEIKQPVTLSYTPARIFSENEIQILKFYQIIFFKMLGEVYQSKKQNVVFYYYAVPVDSTFQIDWPYLHSLYNQFLQNFVYCDVNIENLIWNPFTKEFLIYQGKSDQLIENKIGETTFLDFFQNRYNVVLDIKAGAVLFKASSTDDVCSAVRKSFNLMYSPLSAAIDLPANDVNYSLGNNCIPNSNNKIGVDSYNHIDKVDSLSDSINSSDGDSSTEMQDDFQIDKINSSNDKTNRISNSSNEEFTSLNVCQNGDFYKNRMIDSIAKRMETLSIYSSECSFTTPIKRSILVEIELFKRNYRLIEDLFIALELKESFDLKLDPVFIVKSFTQRRENQVENYERLEFLGDGVLKFLTTNFLFLMGYQLDKIVSFKDSVVCNANLFKCALKSGIYKFLKTTQFSPKMVQAPHIGNVGELKGYFHVKDVLNSDNYMYFSTKSQDSDSVAIKVYADMIEALIGSLFLDNDIKEAYKFVCRLGIILPDTLTESDSDLLIDEKDDANENIKDNGHGGSLRTSTGINNVSDVNDKRDVGNNVKTVLNARDLISRGLNTRNQMIRNLISENLSAGNIKNEGERLKNFSESLSEEKKAAIPEPKKEFLSNFVSKINILDSLFFGSKYTFYQYNEFVTRLEISGVENIIGYKFLNPGNLERAIVHPSFTASFGCQDFQYLELIGDSSLDLFVDYLVFQNSSLNTPLLLHSAKKSYVNNISLRKLFYRFGLDKYAKLFGMSTPDSKAFSDVVEAIIGAILVDTQWDYNKFVQAMSVSIKGMLEECRSELNLD